MQSTNKLSKSITRQFFTTDEGYETLVKNWKAFCAAKNGNSGLLSHHLLAYAILRGRDWRKSFTRITNHIKLENGQDPNVNLKWAIYRLPLALEHPIFANANLNPNIKNMIKSVCSGSLDKDAYVESAEVAFGVSLQ